MRKRAATKIERSDDEITSREYMAARRLHLNCTLCRPHRGENSTRVKHGPRKQNKRRHAKRPNGRE